MYSFYHVTKAICQIDHPENFGYILLAQYPNNTILRLHLKNLPPGKHGFHIHKSADLRKGCDSLGSHYNPYGHAHGGLNEPDNHLGDLGNITVDDDGTCNQTIIANDLPLVGECQVIGRSMVIHSGVDDLGRGGDEESLKTGNSGSRIACGIIGYL